MEEVADEVGDVGPDDEDKGESGGEDAGVRAAGEAKCGIAVVAGAVAAFEGRPRAALPLRPEVKTGPV